MIGPNMRDLILRRMSTDAIPPGSGRNAFAIGLKFLSSKESIMKGFKKAQEWVEQAIVSVRQAGEPNPWKTATDEEICGEILRQIKELDVQDKAKRWLS